MWLNKRWEIDNMDLMLVFRSWGIEGQLSTLIQIAEKHFETKSSLQHLNRILIKAYHPDEIPNVLLEHSPALGSSILDFLCDVEDGAGHIVDMIETRESL